MFENKFVSLPSHLKTIEPMEVHRELRTMCNTETSKVISRTDPMIVWSQYLFYGAKYAQRTETITSMAARPHAPIFVHYSIRVISEIRSLLLNSCN